MDPKILWCDKKGAAIERETLEEPITETIKQNLRTQTFKSQWL
jgi:hypothetical protein